MRINIFTYSGSAEFEDKFRDRLTGGLIALGYGEEEIPKLYDQVFSLKLTPSFDTEKRGDMRFNEVNVVVDRDQITGVTFMPQPDTDAKYFAVVTPSDQVTGAEKDRVTSDAYSVYMAIDGILHCPELHAFIVNAINAPKLEPNLRFQVPGITGRVYEPATAIDLAHAFDERMAPVRRAAYDAREAGVIDSGHTETAAVNASDSISIPTEGYNTGASMDTGETTWVRRTGKTPPTIGNPQARINPTSGAGAREIPKPNTGEVGGS